MDHILTNKYFCIAILIALAVLLYLYSQNRSCEIETMRTVDLTPLAQELNSPPWTNSLDPSNYGKVNTKFDLMADAYTKAKLIKNGYRVKNNVPSDSQEFAKYQRSETSPASTSASDSASDSMTVTDSESDSATDSKFGRRNRFRSRNQFRLPQPLNDRPDLSQCVPCPPCGGAKSSRRANRIRNRNRNRNRVRSRSRS